MKTCITCNNQKSFSEFAKRIDSKDGLRNNCKLCQKERDAKNYQNNLLNRRNQQSTYYVINAKKILKQKEIYRLNNMPKIIARNVKRYAAKLQRTPRWLTREHLGEIEQFYSRASMDTKKLGIKFEVDHIIPLQGKNVSGLHVPWNLQILTEIANIKKGNKVFYG